MGQASGITFREKPLHSVQSLQGITVQQLHRRLHQVDNALAQPVAHALWNMMGLSINYRVSGLLGQGAGQSAWRTAGLAPGRLLAMLRRMRKISFSRLVLEGPEEISGRLGLLNPLRQGRLKPPSARDPQRFASHLAACLEFYINPWQLLPWRPVRAVLSLLAALAICLLAIWFMAGWHYQYEYDLLMIGFVQLAGLALLGLLVYDYSVLSEQRLLALYISFTDEFVTGEPEWENIAE